MWNVVDLNSSVATGRLQDFQADLYIFAQWKFPLLGTTKKKEGILDYKNKQTRLDVSWESAQLPHKQL